MNFTKDQNAFIIDYVKALKENNAVVFAGAGMSVSQGFFDWEKLLKPVADQLGLEISEENDLTALAQYFVDNAGGNRGALSQLLTEEYGKMGIAPSEVHQILARLPISIYWTTNYDQLIETALKQRKKTPDVKKSQSDLAINKPRRDAIVYKMHGDIDSVAETVLTKHEYEDYNVSRELFSNAFKSDFVSRTFLFIGFSFKDPNLGYLISRIRSTLGQNKRYDYYFIKRDQDTKKQHKQEIRVNSLKMYGLHPIWIDDYSEIPVILKEVESRYLRNTVLISGSADIYGEIEEKDAQQFLHNLSKTLSQNGYKILSGFGLGVGSSVINGVLDNMQQQHNQNIDNYIIMRPFPQVATNGQLEAQWQKYRQSFIPLAGIALFVFGNKGGGSVLADGMEQEFNIALNAGLKVIPVGATGYMSEKLYQMVMSDFENYYPGQESLKPVFEKLILKPMVPSNLINSVVELVQALNK